MSSRLCFVSSNFLLLGCYDCKLYSGSLNTEIDIEGISKELVGEFAANVRKVRGPEPYKGKGIKYKDEHIRRKEGKKASK